MDVAPCRSFTPQTGMSYIIWLGLSVERDGIGYNQSPIEFARQQSNPKILAGLFMGLKRAFDGHGIKTYGQGVEDEWEEWKHEALFKSAMY
ncbi:hypothetical protein E4U10_001796 [Claviceps purpurea]|nr:hypothetical protein E4U10_001796 [Claviceps purpurea]